MLKVEKFVFESFTELDENQTEPVISDQPAATKLEEVKPTIDQLVIETDKNNLSDTDLNQLKQKSFDEGYQQAQSELDKSILITNQHLTLVLERIKSSLDEIEASSASNEQLINDCNNLALKIAKKIAGDALKEDPIAKIEEIVKKCLNLLKGNLTVNLVVHPSIEGELKPKLDELIKATGFNGDIIIKTDQVLAQTDCHIEWHNGHIESNKEQVWQQIEQQINNV